VCSGEGKCGMEVVKQRVKTPRVSYLSRMTNGNRMGVMASKRLKEKSYWND